MDKAKRLEILAALGSSYPNTIDVQRGLVGLSQLELAPYLRYLEHHQLVSMTWSSELGNRDKPLWGSITAGGVDYLDETGGMTAELNVLTVKLHEDTIRALLLDHVDKSTAEPSIKDKLRKQITALPAEALKTIATEGLKAGLAKIPDVAMWLQKLLGP